MNRVLRSLTLWLAPALGVATLGSIPAFQEKEEAPAMQVYFLEIVTAESDATCKALAEIHGVEFGQPVPEFGNARTARLEGGGELSVRKPLRPDEGPVVRPYLLVDDIEAAAAAAKEAGAEIAIPPMEIPGRGKFSIYLLGGIEHGLWQR